jgi:hypothetical protein
MLHNASYDFDDALILRGGSISVRLAESWFNVAQPATLQSG